MSDFGNLLEKALKANEDLIGGANKIISENSMHLDKVDPKIRANFEKAQREVEKKQAELDKLKNDL